MQTTIKYPFHIAASAVALGICADLLFFERMPGISLFVFVALCMLALAVHSLREAIRPTWSNIWLGVGALAFAFFLALRSEGWLTFFNVVACLGLLLLQVGLFRDTPLSRLPAYQYVLRVFLALGELGLRPAPLAFGLAASTIKKGARIERFQRFVPVGRGLAIALPVVGMFTMLLMAADSVFASYVTQITHFELPFSLDQFVVHGMLIGSVAWVCAGALATALRQPFLAPPGALPSEGDTRRLTPDAAHTPWRLGWVEATTVLAAVDLLFLSFVIIQAAYFFGGLDTLARTGMTFADYARRGFFELLAVACLSIGMLWLLAALTRRDSARERRAFNGACVALIVLVLALLGSACYRMWLYEQAYGFTHLRLYTHSFMVWLAMLLVLFLAALLANRPRWFGFGGLVSALLVLAALNIANPEALIVRANVQRYLQTGSLAVDEGFDLEPSFREGHTLDAAFLARLSPDATPTLVAVLPQLDAASQQVVRASLANQLGWLNSLDDDGWPAFHFGRARAKAVLQGVVEAGQSS